jgi:hypothetical protein
VTPEDLLNPEDRALVEEAIAQFVVAVCDGRFTNADELARIAFGVWALAAQPVSPDLREEA